MSRFINQHSFGLMIAAAIGLGTLGCNQGDTTAPSANPSDQADHHADHQEADHHHNGDAAHHDADDQRGDAADGEAAAIQAQLAKLPPEDRATAEAQQVCPVTGEPLGSMGVPHKVTVAGRDVFLCCQACEKAVQTEPEKYLEKLPE